MSNLVSFNTKFLQYLPKSSLSFAPLAVLSPVYAATGTALSLTLTSTGLVEPRLLHAATVVLNHRTFFISCYTALYWTICVGPYSAIPYHFWTFGPVRGESPDYWDSAELIRVPIPRNGSDKSPPALPTNQQSKLRDFLTSSSSHNHLHAGSDCQKRGRTQSKTTCRCLNIIKPIKSKTGSNDGQGGSARK